MITANQKEVERQTKDLIHRMKQFAQLSGRSQDKVLQRSAKRITIFSIAKTKVASRPEIDAAMSATSYKSTTLQFTKAGKLKKPSVRQRNWQGTSAAAIYAYWRRVKGKGKPSSAVEFYKGVDKMVKGRRRAINYWKSGWFPALSEYGGGKRLRARQFPKPPGDASTQKHAGSRPARVDFQNWATRLWLKNPEIVTQAMQDRVHELDRDIADQMVKNANKAKLRVRIS